jgi:hypothetical protein
MSATNPSHSSAIIGHNVSEPSSGRSQSPSENLAENDAGIAVSAPNIRQREYGWSPILHDLPIYLQS